MRLLSVVMLATVYYGDIDPDFHDGYENGIHPLFSPKDPKSAAHDWASIAVGLEV